MQNHSLPSRYLWVDFREIVVKKISIPAATYQESLLPKPLKSIRDPVSIRAVAIIVSDPPSSMLRAEPEKRFGRCNAFASTLPESTLPLGGTCFSLNGARQNK